MFNLNLANITVSASEYVRINELSYILEANIFGESAGIMIDNTGFTGVFGPFDFTCYNVIESNITIESSVELVTETGFVAPSFMSFSEDTNEVTITSAEEYTGILKLQSTYTGVYNDYTLSRSILTYFSDEAEFSTTTEELDKYCLGTYKKAACGFFVLALCIILIGAFLLILYIIYLHNSKPKREEAGSKYERSNNKDLEDFEMPAIQTENGPMVINNIVNNEVKMM